MQDSSLVPSSEFPDHAIGRRRFVNMLGFGGAAMVLGPSLGQLASWFAPAKADTDLFGIPQEWVEKLGHPIRGYVAFLAGLQLKHLTVRQIIAPHIKERGGVYSGIPPASLWKHMKPTLLVADEIGRRLGENVEDVISAYRSPAYNARCPGAASGSMHMRNVALDLVFRSSTRTVNKVAHEIRADGKFKGGIGLYPDFVHVDTRGSNAHWGRA